MKKIIITGMAGPPVVAALGFAAPAQAARSYFGADGVEAHGDLRYDGPAGSFGNPRTNLPHNFGADRALENLHKNLDPGAAVDNLKVNLGIG